MEKVENWNSMPAEPLVKSKASEAESFCLLTIAVLSMYIVYKSWRRFGGGFEDKNIIYDRK